MNSGVREAEVPEDATGELSDQGLSMAASSALGRAQTLPLPLDSPQPYRPEDFIASPANIDAVQAVMAWPAWPAQGMVLTGPVGSGKRHLAHLWAARSNARFLTSADLTADFLSAFEAGAYVLSLDAEARSEGERQLFHFYNAARESGSWTLYLSEVAPTALKYGLHDLTSRLRSLPVVALTQPDDSLLEAIILKAFGNLQLKVSPEIAAYMIAHTDRAPEALLGLTQTLNTEALLRDRKITLPFVREVVRRLQEDPAKK